MIHLRLLGAASLSDAKGDEVRSVLAQPKRFALLAYLALESADGPCARGLLLPVFWPEADESHARSALNSAVHRLRSSLGAGVLVSRGGDELGIAPGELWCDVTAFEGALAAGDADAALELYRDDLLGGLAVSGAAPFERWLETTRWRLRERARTAARSLVDESEARGELDAAVRWARRSLGLVPEDERALRRLLALLARAGDRAGALEAYEVFRRAFEGAYGEAPSAETRAMVDRLRQAGRADGAHDAEDRADRADAADAAGAAEPVDAADAVDRADRADAVDAAGAIDPADALPPAPDVADAGRPGRGDGPVGSPAVRERPVARPFGPRRGGSRRARLLLRFGLPAVLAVAAAAVALRSAWVPSAPAAGPGGVAVLPFTVYGGTAFEYLGEGMPLLLADGLDGIERYRAVDPRTLLAYVADSNGGEFTPRRGAEVARHFRAPFFVLGTVLENDGRLRISASLYDHGSAPTVRADARVEGDRADLFALVDELTLRLLRELDGGVASSAGGAIPATHSLAALKAYLEGQREARSGRYRSAAAAYRRAIEADSGFALAHHGLSVAANWNGEYALARAAVERALRHEDRLSARGRLAARAWLSYLTGEAHRAEPLYRALVREDPTDADAWFYLGEIGFHQLAALGRPMTASRDAWERVIELGPDHAGALIHLARLAALEGRTTRLDSLVARLLALDISPLQSLELRALGAFVTGDRSDRERIRAEVAAGNDAAAHTAVWSVAVYSGDLAGATALAGTLTSPDRPPAQRILARLLRARLLLTGGRLDAARAELERLAPLAPAWAVEYRAMAAALPFLSVPDQEIEAARLALARLRDTPGTGPVEALRPWSGTGPARRLYLLGALSLRLGETSAAEARARALERFRGTGARDTALAHRYARTLRAEIARRRGATRQALAILDGDDAPRSVPASGVLDHPTAHERWLRAELLRELGRYPEALRAYAHFTMDYNLMYRTAGYLRRAGIHERMGEPERAARLYRRASRDWRDADAALAPLVEAARRGLIRTTPG